MAQITALQFYGVPGRTRTFSAKAAALVTATTAIHIFSDSGIDPAHATDNLKSVLIKDGLEVQENIWVGDGTDYLAMLKGKVRLYGTARVFRHIRIGAGSWKPGNTAPTAGFSGVYPHLSFADGAEEEAHYEVINPFRRATGAAIDIVVDWYYAGVQDNGTVSWNMEYLSCAVGEDPTANGANVAVTSIGSHPTGKLVRTSFAAGAIASGLINDGEPLGMRFWRDGDNVAQDTLGKAAILIAVHLHYIMDKLGQAT